MRIIAIIQARTGSTRLPGKVLQMISGKTMLERVLERAAKTPSLERCMIATTDKPQDDPIENFCTKNKISFYRGSEENVLDRYYQTALSVKAGTIVRITSDCPLIDPDLIEEVIQTFQSSGADYASNSLKLSFPRGLDTEVFSFKSLENAWKNAREDYEKVHVTPYIYRHPEKFKLHTVSSEFDYSKYRWTVDTPDDLKLVREIYSRLEHKENFDWKDVLQIMQSDPSLQLINDHVRQKKLEEK